MANKIFETYNKIKAAMDLLNNIEQELEPLFEASENGNEEAQRLIDKLYDHTMATTYDLLP